MGRLASYPHCFGVAQATEHAAGHALDQTLLQCRHVRGGAVDGSAPDVASAGNFDQPHDDLHAIAIRVDATAQCIARPAQWVSACCVQPSRPAECRMYHFSQEAGEGDLPGFIAADKRQHGHGHPIVHSARRRRTSRATCASCHRRQLIEPLAIACRELAEMAEAVIGGRRGYIGIAAMRVQRAMCCFQPQVSVEGEGRMSGEPMKLTAQGAFRTPAAAAISATKSRAARLPCMNRMAFATAPGTTRS